MLFWVEFSFFSHFWGIPGENHAALMNLKKSADYKHTIAFGFKLVSFLVVE